MFEDVVYCIRNAVLGVFGQLVLSIPVALLIMCLYRHEEFGVVTICFALLREKEVVYCFKKMNVLTVDF